MFQNKVELLFIILLTGSCAVMFSLSFVYRYGFGSEGKPEYKIGPDRDIVYEVTLKHFQRVSLASYYVWTNKQLHECGFGLFFY